MTNFERGPAPLLPGLDLPDAGARSWQRDDAMRRDTAAITRHAVALAGADDGGAVLHRTGGGAELLSSTGVGVTALVLASSRGVAGPLDRPLPPGAVLALDTIVGDGRWSEWCRLAQEQGYGSAEIIGLVGPRGRAASLELLWRGARPTDARLPDSVVVARWAGVELRRADRVANLERALLTRSVIGRAQGIVMERYGVSADEAMAYLRRQSQASQRTLADIAGALVGPQDHRPPG